MAKVLFAVVDQTNWPVCVYVSARWQLSPKRERRAQSDPNTATLVRRRDVGVYASNER